MHARIGELLEYIDSERAKLRAAFESVPPERQRQTPAPGQWSAVQVIEHLGVVERRVAAMFRKTVAEARAAGVGAETETSSVLGSLALDSFVDRTRRITSPAATNPSPSPDAGAVWAALDAARQDFRAAVMEADGLALYEISAPHPVFGPLNFYRWIGFVGAHDARHAQQIRAIDETLRNPVGMR